jgi:hypothetical protein
MLKKLLLFAVIFAALGVVAQERTNTIYAREFQGGTVAAKVTAAQAACNPDVSIPCYIVIDAELAVTTVGSLPAKCSQCIWIDYRAGSPFGNLGAIVGDVLPATTNSSNMGNQTKAWANISALAYSGPGDIGIAPSWGTVQWNFKSTGVIAPATTNAKDIGQNGLLVRRIFVGDGAGLTTLSAGAATVTFGTAYTGTAPVCVCSDTTAVAAVKCSASLTQLTITGTATDVIAWACYGK